MGSDRRSHHRTSPFWATTPDSTVCSGAMKTEFGSGQPILLWHGRGPESRRVLLPLAEALADRGRRAVVPAWDAAGDDGGRSDLLKSVREVRESTERPDNITVVGHCLGGIAAASLCLNQRRLGIGLGRVVCVDAAPFLSPDPLSGADLLPDTPPIARDTTVAFVNGDRGDLAPLSVVRTCFDQWQSAGWPITFTTFGADHDSWVTDHVETLADLIVKPSPP